jgi:hypothetical protein
VAQPLVHIIHKRIRGKWDASKHPRDANGRFISVGDLVTTDDIFEFARNKQPR